MFDFRRRMVDVLSAPVTSVVNSGVFQHPRTNSDNAQENVFVSFQGPPYAGLEGHGQICGQNPGGGGPAFTHAATIAGPKNERLLSTVDFTGGGPLFTNDDSNPVGRFL